MTLNEQFISRFLALYLNNMRCKVKIWDFGEVWRPRA